MGYDPRKGYRVEQQASGLRSRVVFEKGRFSLPGLGFTITTPRGQKATFDAQGAIENVATFPRIDAEARPTTDAARQPRRCDSRGSRTPPRARSPGQLQVQGPLPAPRFAGGFDLEHGEIAIRGLPLPVSDIVLALRVDRSELRVEKGSAKVGSGTVQVTGGAPLRSLEARSSTLRDHGARARIAHERRHSYAVAGCTDLTVNVKPADADGERELAPSYRGCDAPLVRVQAPGHDDGRHSPRMAQRGKRTEVDTYDPADDVLAFELRLRSLCGR